MTGARAELDHLLDEFSMGRLPSIGFVRRVKELRDADPGLVSPDPSLGTAVVVGFGRHTAGRDIMSLLLEILGFAVRNVQVTGGDTEAVEACQGPGVTALCLSAQSTEGANGAMDIIREVDDTAARSRIVVCAGGSSFSAAQAEKAGCDVFTGSAVDSARAVRDAVRSRKGPLA